MPADAAGPARAPPELEEGPLLHRQDAGRVRPVLERGRLARVPVGALDPLPRHGPEPGVGDKLVRPGQDADRVKLDGAQPAQQADHPAAPPGRSEEPPRAQRDPPYFAG
jgi:hypothetical protein